MTEDLGGYKPVVGGRGGVRERVNRDRAYYKEYNKSHLATRPDIDVQWYFDQVEDLERRLAEALAQTIYEQERNRNNVGMADEEIRQLKATLEQTREALRALRKSSLPSPLGLITNPALIRAAHHAMENKSNQH